jgi:hypothetical protein
MGDAVICPCAADGFECDACRIRRLTRERDEAFKALKQERDLLREISNWSAGDTEAQKVLRCVFGDKLSTR